MNDNTHKQKCTACDGSGEIIHDWNAYMHGETQQEREAAVKDCAPCHGEGYVEATEDNTEAA